MDDDVRFCRTADGVSIAYKVMGSGPPVLIAPGSHTHLGIRFPGQDAYIGLQKHHTLVVYDRRGTGLSDRNVSELTPEQIQLDIQAVVEAAGLDRFALFAESWAGPTAIDYAASNPARVSQMILLATWARPGPPSETALALLRLFDTDRRLAEKTLVEMMVPDDATLKFVNEFTDYVFQAIDPALERHQLVMEWHDQRPLLPLIEARVLIIRRKADAVLGLAAAQQLAALIPNARLLLLDGRGHFPVTREQLDELTTPMLEFLAEEREPRRDGPAATPSPFRTILFTDVVSSTPLLAQLKDAKMREVMRGHDEVLSAAVSEHGGRVIKTISDAFMAEFAVPSAAVEAAIEALRAIRERFANADVPVRLRIGIKAGEPIEEAGDLHGTSVVIAKRLESAAGVNGILVSDVVKQMVRGKDFEFEDRGLIELKGFDEPVRAWAVRWD